MVGSARGKPLSCMLLWLHLQCHGGGRVVGRKPRVGSLTQRDRGHIVKIDAEQLRELSPNACAPSLAQTDEPVEFDLVEYSEDQVEALPLKSTS